MGQTTEELNSEIAQTRQSLANDLDALQDKVNPSAVIQRRKEAVSSRVSGLGSRVMGSTKPARHSASHAASASGDSIQGAASGVVDAAESKVEGSPLAAGLVAFGVGVVVAGLMPATEAESRAARTVVDTAKEQGGPIADAAKSAAQEMTGELRGQASAAVADVKQTAQESGGRVGEEASTSSDRVRFEAT